MIMLELSVRDMTYRCSQPITSNTFGVDEEAEKEKRKASERESLLKMKENCKLPDGTTVKWYTELYEESKERFEKEFGEPLCLEEELNTET